MLESNAQKMLFSLVNAELYTEEHPVLHEDLALPLVTVSRSCGSNGTEVARLLAERLGVRFFDKELLNEMVKQAKSDKYLMEQLDEKVTGLMDELIAGFFSHHSVTREEYYHHLLKVLMGISRTGGVIVGRGAHLLLPNRKIFRLRLEGSPETCIDRIAQRYDWKKAKAAKEIAKANAERVEFVRKIAKRFKVRQQTYYDMVLNTDIFKPDQAVTASAGAMKALGFLVPDQPVVVGVE